MTKYKKYFQEMVTSNSALFEAFKKTHDNYVLDKKKWQDQFNKEGEEVLKIIKHYENLLCGHSENVGYAKFSSGLADKFWSEVRAYLPRIDFVGIK